MNGPYDVIDTGRNSRIEYGNIITVRENITSDDIANPQNFDDCFDLSGWEYIDVYIKVSGTNPAWDITPIFGLDEANFDFYDGEGISVSKNEVRRMQVLGAKYLYFRCDNSSGTTPKIESIKIRPVNMSEK